MLPPPTEGVQHETVASTWITFIMTHTRTKKRAREHVSDVGWWLILRMYCSLSLNGGGRADEKRRIYREERVTR